MAILFAALVLIGAVTLPATDRSGKIRGAQPAGITRTHAVALDPHPTSFFDQRNRRVSKQLYDATAGTYAVWYFYYDPLEHLVEIKYWPDTSSSSTYSVFQVSWVGKRAVAMFQTDYPGGTLSRRYVHADDTVRPIEMYTWPSSGDASRMWGVNPDAWGNDESITGTTAYQPFVLSGQYRDDETIAWHDHGQPQRPALLHLGTRLAYDSWLGTHMQANTRRADGSGPYDVSSYNPVQSVALDDDPHDTENPNDVDCDYHQIGLGAGPDLARRSARGREQFRSLA